ncbi:MAG TPA: lysophospholipase [Bacteroidales bacterium]|nr:lysophospholipase [Bacteroidales bacterium]
MDFNIKLSNGQVLTGIIQSPGENVKAVIILVHGLGEHIQRYTLWADLFKKEGIGFAGVDLPGHGRSEGRRGNIKNYALLNEMISILVTTCKRTFPGTPLYVYGHSLGGGIVLNYLLKNKPRINGAIVTSPWLRLSYKPSRVKLMMASVMKNILPWLVQPSGLNVNHISHDGAIVEKYQTDPLNHGKISVSLYYGANDAAKYVLSHASELKVRTLILHGSDDQITSPEGSREFAGKTRMAELKIIEGGYHELHNEPFKEIVFRYIMEWILRPKS